MEPDQIRRMISLVEVGGITSMWVLERALLVPQDEIREVAKDIWGDIPLRRVVETVRSEDTNPLANR